MQKFLNILPSLLHQKTRGQGVSGPQGTDTERARASRAAPEEQRAAESLMRGRSEAETEAETEGKKIHQRLRATPANHRVKPELQKDDGGGLEF